jgi:hypothetical protein
LVVTNVCLLFAAGCSSSGRPIERKLHDHVATPDQRVVIFLVDGLDPDYVRRGAAAGWLPNIERIFVTGGLDVQNAITTIPSVTYSAITSMFTGRFPYEHGVMGIYWFDPDRRLFRNYKTVRHYRTVNADFDVPTLYEQIAPAKSVSIQNAVSRGVGKNYPNWAGSGVRWFFKNYTAVDKLTASTWRQVVAEANRTGRWPAVATLYFPGVDAVGHTHGPGSDAYRNALMHFDHQLGRVHDWLAAENMLRDTHLILISDHGMVATSPDNRIDLPTLIGKTGVSVTDRPMQNESFAQRARYYDPFETVVVYHTGRRAALYVQGPTGWDSAPTAGQVAAVAEGQAAGEPLSSHPGIDLVAYQNADGDTIVRTDAGAARISERIVNGESQFAYIPQPDDALGYLDDPGLARFVRAGYHDQRAWLHATAAHRYPDLATQVGPVLRTARGGNVLIFAKPGWCFVDQYGGHGGVSHDEMAASFFIAGPTISPNTTLPVARTLDLTPTVHDLLTSPRDATRPPLEAHNPGLSVRIAAQRALQAPVRVAEDERPQQRLDGK